MRVPFAFMFYIIFLINYVMIANCFLGFALEFNNETDRLALLAFKDAITTDPNGVLKSWNTSLHYCQWQGVSCSTKHPQRVTSLNLPLQGLVGRLSPLTGNLSFLENINLANNSFHGEIPQEIGKLFRLRILWLRNNSFHGEITTNLSGCTSLQEIRFADNNLKGKIPVELSYLHNLEVLHIGRNNLEGRIPSSLGNLSSLSLLFLGQARLVGSFPDDLGRLTRLQFLAVHANNLTGTIPSTIFNLSGLTDLAIASNRLEGKLPSDMGITLPNLQNLYFGVNLFTGLIPTSLSNASQLQLFSSLGNLSSLVELSLARTGLDGSIPEEFGRLTRLKFLVIFGNNLTGNIPSSFYNWSSLNAISVTENRLQGNIPSDMGITLPNLRYIYFGLNLFTGFLPSSLSNASHLETVSFLGNNLQGLIPEEFGRLVNLSWIGLELNMLGSRGGNDLSFVSHLANCTNLKRLLLAENLLKGPFPKSISNLSIEMRYLTLHLNQIYGEIPSEIGNLVNLNVLDLEKLMLRGNIPSTIGKLRNLIFLYININRLTGKIPSTLGNHTSLTDLFLDENNLSGEIPTSLGNCRQILKLNLARNNLQGLIPASIFGLHSAIDNDFSQNSFSGSLPPDIGNLKQLESLDVSKNKLSGVVPNTLGSCSTLQYLNLSGNSLAGTILQILVALRGLLQIDLSGNNFSGIVPNSPGLLQLQELNLSFNNFEGEVPKIGIFKNVSVISLIGNNKLRGGIPELKLPACTILHSRKIRVSLALKIIVPSIAVTFFLVLLASFFLLRYRRNKLKDLPPSGSLNNPFIQISYLEPLEATDGFSDNNLIGSGSYGSVYGGFLPQIETFVAVKVFNLHHKGASKSFVSECKALRTVRHRNLLKIVSVCSSVDRQGNDFRAIIYEFMPRDSLERWLHPQKAAANEPEPEVRSLNFEQRLNIAIDVATAVEYLHCDCQPPIVHGDLKPSNVLLDEDMVARVGDFGLAKVLSSGSDCWDIRGKKIT